MALPRPKTSHTTLEGRYHPYRRSALLKTRNAVGKIKKNVKGGIVVKGFGICIIESEDGSVVDVINERGFVDGVKVARKRSVKPISLGWLWSTSRDLKKREHRLRVEQAGLISLFGGVDGGPTSVPVEEWEVELKIKVRTRRS